MKITMFGTGYVGLVTGTCFAEMGNDVLCIDIDEAKVAELKAGRIPIYEPGLAPMVVANQNAGRLHFSSDIEAGVEHGEVLFIAVGTPSGEDGSADLSYVLSVAGSIGTYMQTPKIIVDKSTVPVGTADKVRSRIARELEARNSTLSFEVSSNPEFLKEGAAIADFMRPDRIILGVSSEAAAEQLKALYAPFNRNHDKVIVMDVRSAELTKYAANVMLATKISMMNEVANLAERLGADVDAVRRGIGADPRIGYHFIYPGAGYGGSCFPKDVKALIHTASETAYNAQIIRSVEAVNEAQKHIVFQKIKSYFDGELNGKTVALWGLAFKPNTDDMREAPSRVLIRALLDAGCTVAAYDPAALDEARHIFKDEPSIRFCETRGETLDGADVLAIMTEWNEFRSPDLKALKAALRHPAIFDGRNLYDPWQLAREGFDYFSIGRPTVPKSG